MRKRLCTQRVAWHWNGLPREGVTAPSLPGLKNSLAIALGHRVWFLRLSRAGPGAGQAASDCEAEPALQALRNIDKYIPVPL